MSPRIAIKDGVLCYVEGQQLILNCSNRQPYHMLSDSCCMKYDSVLEWIRFIADGKEPRQWIIEEQWNEEIIHALHSDTLSEHFGRDKTREKVCSRYYWLGMVKAIDNYIETCQVCQRYNPCLIKAPKKLHPIPVKEVWNRCVCMHEVEIIMFAIM